MPDLKLTEEQRTDLWKAFAGHRVPEHLSGIGDAHWTAGVDRMADALAPMLDSLYAEAVQERDKARGIAVELKQQLGEIQRRLGEIALDRERRDVEEFSGESVTAFRTAEECLAAVDDVTDPFPGESFTPATAAAAPSSPQPPPLTYKALADLYERAGIQDPNKFDLGSDDLQALFDDIDWHKAEMHKARREGKDQAAKLGKAVATAEKLKAGVARQRETIDAVARIAYDEMWGERFPHRGHDDTSGGPDCAGCWADMILQAIGEEPKDPKAAAHFDVAGPRNAYRDALAVADTAFSRWPYSESPTAQAHRRNLRKLASQLGDARPTPRRGTSKYSLEDTVKRLNEKLRPETRLAISKAAAELLDRDRRVGALAAAIGYAEEAPAAATAEPTWQSIKLAAWRAGYRLALDDEFRHDPLQGQYFLRTPDGHDTGEIGWEHDEYGPGVLWTFHFDGPKNDVTVEGEHVTPADVLAAARLAGLITK